MFSPREGNHPFPLFAHVWVGGRKWQVFKSGEQWVSCLLDREEDQDNFPGEGKEKVELCCALFVRSRAKILAEMNLNLKCYFNALIKLNY